MNRGESVNASKLTVVTGRSCLRPANPASRWAMRSGDLAAGVRGSKSGVSDGATGCTTAWAAGAKPATSAAPANTDAATPGKLKNFFMCVPKICPSLSFTVQSRKPPPVQIRLPPLAFRFHTPPSRQRRVQPEILVSGADGDADDFLPVHDARRR